MWGYIIAGLIFLSLVYLLVRRDHQDMPPRLSGMSQAKNKTKQPIKENAISQSLSPLIIDQTQFRRIHAIMHEHIVGMDTFLYGLYISLLLSGGHVLVEGVPGLAKTKTIDTLAKVLDLDFKRIQFTPDMLPGDLTGVEIFDSQKKNFRFVHGPLFAQVILADEINRTTPKVQSALLEAMQEQQISVGGTSYPLPNPFMVFATQNPLEQEGTYHLPEAQVDRFLFKILVTYPSPDAEEKMLSIIEHESPVIKPVIGAEQLLQWQQDVANIEIADDIQAKIVRMVQSTRNSSLLKRGASPRASLALQQASKAVAWLQGRDYVILYDVHMIALLVLRHRVVLSYDVIAQGRTVDDVLVELLDEFC